MLGGLGEEEREVNVAEGGEKRRLSFLVLSKLATALESAF